MADNVTVTAGTNTTIAADEVTDGTLGTVKVQYVKIMDGTLDGTAKALVNVRGLAVDIPAAAAAIAKAEDAASASGDVGVPAMAIQKATPADTASADDYSMLQMSAGSLWVASVATDKTLVADRVINGGAEYETVAASQTNQVLGPTGAAGDYLSHVIISPATAGCGAVTVYDNATAVISFPGGGTTALPSLVPFVVPVGIISTSGAWKVTTGANVSVTGVGNFT